MNSEEVVQNTEKTDEELVEYIRQGLLMLNEAFEKAGKRDISVQVTMVTGKIVPTFRLDSAYKRIDKQLILRV